MIPDALPNMNKLNLIVKCYPKQKSNNGIISE